MHYVLCNIMCLCVSLVSVQRFRRAVSSSSSLCMRVIGEPAHEKRKTNPPGKVAYRVLTTAVVLDGSFYAIDGLTRSCGAQSKQMDCRDEVCCIWILVWFVGVFEDVVKWCFVIV